MIYQSVFYLHIQNTDWVTALLVLRSPDDKLFMLEAIPEVEYGSKIAMSNSVI